jgi:CheY-like chemotaxis protein
MVTILVIEDEAPIRENLQRFLRFEGYAVETAENGAIGLDTLQTTLPDLILCDVMMPVMTGFELLVEVKKNPALATIPFVFLTASAEKDCVEKGLAMGANAYVTKPFELGQVLRLVKEWLNATPER